MQTKTCGTCQLLLPVEEFVRDSSRADGLRSRCRRCLASARAKRRSATKDAERNAAYYRRNRERLASRSAEHQRVNPHIDWKSKYLKRTSACGQEPVVEDFTKPDVIAMYGDSCFYCETGEFEHLDHYVPVSKGGPHTLENVRPSCASCNARKGDNLTIDRKSQPCQTS